MLARFWSPAQRLFHDAAEDAEPLLVRPRDIMDNATPSGNSLAAEFLARSAAITGSVEHGEVADTVIARERGALERYPSALGRLLTAALLRATPPLEVAFVDAPRDDRAALDRTAAMLDRAHRHPHPNRVIIGGDPLDPVIAALPAMEGRLARTGHAFVCTGNTCLEPVNSPEGLDAALARAGTFLESAD